MMKIVQEQINLEYEKIMYHRAAVIRLLNKISGDLSALQATCTHPNKRVKKSYDTPFEYCLYEYEEVSCPDCGYFSRTVIN